jgi:hypothetical protein
MGTKTEKQKKLEELDRLVLDKMIGIMKSKSLEALSDLSTAVNYLRVNQVTAEKPKSTVEGDTKKRIAEAKARREKKQQELDDDL